MYNYYRWLGLGFVLVAAVGDSYKISDYWPIGLPITIIVLAFFVLLMLRINQISVKNLAVIVIAMMAFIYGSYKNNLYYLLQDFLPIATSILLFICLKNINSIDCSERLSYYTRIFLVIASLKVFYIIIVRPLPDWGETWISSNYILDGGFPRVMLKGSSPLFFISVVFELINFIKNKKGSVVYLFLGFSLIVLDGSRALLAATLIPSFFVLVGAFKFNTHTVLIKIIPGVGFLLLLVAFVTSASFRSSDPNVSGEFEQVGVESVSAAYRLLEISSAIESVQNVYIGNGLGASFITLASGSVNDNNEGIYVHSFPVWVYVKFGVLGFAIACILFIIFIVKLLRSIVRVKDNPELLVVNVWGIYFLSFVCASFITNLLATFTGAIVASLLAINFIQKRKLMTIKDCGQ